MAPTRKLVATIATVAWTALASALTGGAALAEGLDDHDGKVLYDLCKQCHGVNGAGNEAYLAPAIAGLDRWYIEGQLRNFRDGIRGLHKDDVGGMRMYPMSMWLKTDEAIAAVSQYVASMPKTKPVPTVAGGNASNGKALYATCAACHGQDASGNEGMKSPPLAQASDWYLLSQLLKYKAGVRGANPKNSQAVMMRGMAGTLADEQAMRDVVAYITSLQK